MEFTAIDAPADSSVSNGTVNTGTNGTQTGSDDIVIADPSLSALASLSKSVRGTDQPIKDALNERLGKFETPLKEAYAKKNGQNGQQQKSTPVQQKPTEVPTDKAVDTKKEEGAGTEEKKSTSTVRKPSRLFEKPVVEAAPTEGATENKYFISEDADKRLVELFKPFAGDDVKLENFIKETLPTWRNKVSKAAEHENNFKSLSNDINSAPEPLRKAFVAYKKGDLGAMREAVSGFNNFVDYTKNFAGQEKVAMKALMPKLNLDDASADNYIDIDDPSDPKVKQLKDVAEDLFNKEKVAEEKRIEKQSNESKKLQETATKILLDSIKNLEDSLPDDFDKKGAFMKSVNSIWRTPNGIDSIFYDEEGVPVKDAALRSFYAIHGEDVVAYYQNELYNKEVELQNLIASGVGKSAATASNSRNHISTPTNNLVNQTRSSIKPQKDRYTRV